MRRYSHEAYLLNRFLYAFRSAEFRKRFFENEKAEVERSNVPASARPLIHARDWAGLVEMGAHIYLVNKFARAGSRSIFEVGASFSGETADQFKTRMSAKPLDWELRE